MIKKFYEDDNDINKHNFIKMIQYHACNQYTATYYLTVKFLERYKISRINGITLFLKKLDSLIDSKRLKKIDFIIVILLILSFRPKF